jgi:hypothetical protein
MLKRHYSRVFKVKFLILITKARNSETTKNSYALLYSNVIKLFVFLFFRVFVLKNIFAFRLVRVGEDKVSH